MRLRKLWHKIKVIPVIGIPYELTIGKLRKVYIIERQNRIVKAVGLEKLSSVVNVLQSLDVTYFVDCGTLLGLVRNHNFISWDPDIDFGVIIDKRFNWDNLQCAMEKSNFKKIREWRIDGVITEQTYEQDKLTIDIFGHFLKGNGKMSFYCYTRFVDQRYEFDKYSVYEITTPVVSETYFENLQNVQVSIPINYSEYLEEIYNDDWMTPNPNWVSFSGKGCKLLPEKLGTYISY